MKDMHSVSIMLNSSDAFEASLEEYDLERYRAILDQIKGKPTPSEKGFRWLQAKSLPG